MSNTYTRAQVASHSTPADLWIVVSDEVYDVTKFKETHPGGAKILKAVAGKDATKAFRKHHNERILKRENYRELCIGKIEEKKVDTIAEDEEEPNSPKTPSKVSGGWARLKKIVGREGSDVVKSGTVLKET